nr:Holliday junction branch migration protein RuvA [Nanchangia anserum]
MSGNLVAVTPDRVIIDVAGVGYEVLVTPTTSAGLHTGQSATLSTYLVVREDALTLYGFTDADERATFLTLLSVSGIGPKLALAALAALTPDELRAAVATGDEDALCRIAGVGKKSARRMIASIGDKLGPAAAPLPPMSAATAEDPLVSALENLGWPHASALEAVAAERAANPGADDAQALRGALQYLGAQRG